MNNSLHVHEISNYCADWMFPLFQSIKYVKVTENINNIIQGYARTVGGFKRVNTLKG